MLKIMFTPSKGKKRGSGVIQKTPEETRGPKPTHGNQAEGD